MIPEYKLINFTRCYRISRRKLLEDDEVFIVCERNMASWIRKILPGSGSFRNLRKVGHRYRAVNSSDEHNPAGDVYMVSGLFFDRFYLCFTRAIIENEAYLGDTYAERQENVIFGDIEPASVKVAAARKIVSTWQTGAFWAGVAALALGVAWLNIF